MQKSITFTFNEEDASVTIEAHGYRGRENVLQKIAEMETWLDTYVKPLPKDRGK